MKFQLLLLKDWNGFRGFECGWQWKSKWIEIWKLRCLCGLHPPFLHWFRLLLLLRHSILCEFINFLSSNSFVLLSMALLIVDDFGILCFNNFFSEKCEIQTEQRAVFTSKSLTFIWTSVLWQGKNLISQF